MTMALPAFDGFPAEAPQFLRDLAANNERAWFEAHKSTYLAAVQKPAVALVTALGERLHARFPAIGYDTRVNGAGSLMRIHRDVRFSADKSPYKTEVAMMFTAPGKRMEQPGFGLRLTADQVDLIAGIFAFPKPALEAYRQAVLSETSGPALEAAAAVVRQAGDYPIDGATYKRVPAGYDAAHPRAEWLKFTGLHVFAPQISLAVAQTPALVEVAMGHFLNMAPLYEWIVAHVMNEVPFADE